MNHHKWVYISASLWTTNIKLWILSCYLRALCVFMSICLLLAVWSLSGLPERKTQWACGHAVPLHAVAWHGSARVLAARADLRQEGGPCQALRSGACCCPLQVRLRDGFLIHGIASENNKGSNGTKILPKGEWFHEVISMTFHAPFHKYWSLGDVYDRIWIWLWNISKHQIFLRCILSYLIVQLGFNLLTMWSRQNSVLPLNIYYRTGGQQK